MTVAVDAVHLLAKTNRVVIATTMHSCVDYNCVWVPVTLVIFLRLCAVVVTTRQGPCAWKDAVTVSSTAAAVSCVLLEFG